jgi:hypothetical protein
MIDHKRTTCDDSRERIRLCAVRRDIRGQGDGGGGDSNHDKNYRMADGHRVGERFGIASERRAAK